MHAVTCQLGTNCQYGTHFLALKRYVQHYYSNKLKQNQSINE